MKLLICVAGLLVVAGCSGVPGVPTHLQSAKSAIQKSGGSFVANYGGSWAGTGCAPPFGDGHYQFSGAGYGTFIGGSTEQATLVGNTFNGCTWSGRATLKGINFPRNTITMKLKMKGSGNDPCQSGDPLKFTVIKGTGKFLLAQGSGTVAFTCNGDGSYTDAWSGTITF
jgi:hypothetical protein